MPEAAILGHVNSGPIHGPSPAVEGSPNVSIGGVPMVREGDAFADGTSVASGAPHVRINGRAAARIGDPVTGGGTVAQGCPKVRIGNGGGAGYGKEMLFKSLTDPKDRLILCLSEIALAEHARADERDQPGWMLLHKGIEKWLALPAYSIRDKYDNGGQVPEWVEWDWLMRYQRFQLTVANMRVPIYLFGPEARQTLKGILEKAKTFNVPHDGEEHPFDHTVLPWDELRRHAFQSRPGDGNMAWWLAGTKPDGLAVIAKFVLLAAAKGSVKVDASGKRTICVDAVGLFIHDGFDFEGEQTLGRWDCEDKKFTLPPFGEELHNRAFRDFRNRTGYGCDFRIMNKPELYPVARFCYDPSL